MNSAPRAMVRALFRAIAIPGQAAPYQSLHAKVYYPALYGDSPLERNTGAIPVDTAGGPYPVAILMPGINVGHEAYGWLASELAAAGFVSVIYGWIVEEMPGMVALSPGLDTGALAPDTYGTRPSATALQHVIADLAEQQRAGPLAGQLDLQRILLGGHSAGGSVALFNARPDWFPGLRAVFAYGSHSKASTMLGYAPETVLPLPDALPTLLIGGERDGVIAASAFRYGNAPTGEGDPIGPLQRTFDEGLQGPAGARYLAIVRGANHFSMTWPADTATGRPFLDWPETRPSEQIQTDLAALVRDFARAHLADDEAARERLHTLLADPARIAHSAAR